MRLLRLKFPNFLKRGSCELTLLLEMGPLRATGEAWKGGLQGRTSPYPLSRSVPPRAFGSRPDVIQLLYQEPFWGLAAFYSYFEEEINWLYKFRNYFVICNFDKVSNSYTWLNLIRQIFYQKNKCMIFFFNSNFCMFLRKKWTKQYISYSKPIWCISSRYMT